MSDLHQITNAMRAQWSADAINTLPEGDADLDAASGVVDLLANLRHFCDRHGLDFAMLDRSADRHYLDELRDSSSGEQTS